MDQRLQEYIEEHSFCPEYLFKDWESFLDVLFAEGGRVSSILWWDRCKKSQQHRSVGSGGYADPDDSEYMYAETKLWKNGLDSWTLDAIKEYIAAERARDSNTGTNTSATISSRRSTFAIRVRCSYIPNLYSLPKSE